MHEVGPPSAVAPLMASLMAALLRLDLELVILTGLLVGVLVLGVSVIVWFKRWQEAQRQTPASPTLEDYRALVEQGYLDPIEFDRIREHMEKTDTPSSCEPPSPPANPM